MTPPSKPSPPPERTRILFLTIFAKQEQSYFLDMRLCYLSGALKALGQDNDIAEAYLRRDLSAADRAYNDALLARVRADIVQEGYDEVYVLRAWGAELLQRLEPSAPLLKPFEAFDEAGFRARWRADLQGRGELEPESDALHELLHAEPNLALRILNEDFRPAREWLALFGDEGCVYRRDLREAPAFEGCELPDDGSVSLQGCAFCEVSKGAPRRSMARIVTSVERQVDRLRRLRPAARDLVLIDQAPFAYLPRLVRHIASLGFAPGLTLHLQARVDVLLAQKGRLVESLELARDAGLRLSPYLIGVENFSNRELAILHKGITAGQNEALLGLLDELAERYPASLATEDLSFGFILWTPWTRMEDLRLNLGALRRVRMTRFRGDEILTKLRLSPRVALYHKAQAEGLLLERWPEAHLSNAQRYGYEEESPWRFQDEGVAAAADLVFSEYEGLKPIEQYRFLELVLDHVEGLGRRGTAPLEERRAAFLEDKRAEIAQLKRGAEPHRAREGQAMTLDDATRAQLEDTIAIVAGKLPLREVALRDELRLVLGGGITLRFGPRDEATPHLIAGTHFQASYTGSTSGPRQTASPTGPTPDNHAFMVKLLRALLGRLDRLGEGERSLLIEALGSGLRIPVGGHKRAP